MNLKFYKVGYFALISVTLFVGIAWSVDLMGFQDAVCTALPFLQGFSGYALAIPAVVAPFPVDSELTSMVVAYKNEKLIADEVLPIVPVGLQNFKYKKFALADGFTIPDVEIGRTSQANEVEFGYTEEDSSTLDKALAEAVPNADIENAPAGYNPVARAAVSTMELLLLAREKRAADLVFASGSYAASNRVTLAGNDQFSDYTNSNPLDVMLAKMDLVVMRPNVIVFGGAAWTKVRQHPKIVKATQGNSGDSGVAAIEAVREILEVDKVLVGKGWYNSANKGQSATMARVWGKHIAMIYQDKMADTRGRVTFGYTAEFGNRV
jgi:hypothetical protein